MGPNTILLKNVSKDVLKVKFKQIPIYKLHKFWYTTSYHSPLLGTIQFGVLQKLCVGHGP